MWQGLKRKGADASAATFEPEARRRAIRRRIRRLNARLWGGFWCFVIFLLISIVALNQEALLPDLTPEMRAFLGPAPPTTLISIALVVYSFSALVVSLSRMWSGSDAYKGWSHLGYLFAFYIFYGYGGAIGQNFLAVFAAGVTILGLESYHLWTWWVEATAKQKELLSHLERIAPP